MSSGDEILICDIVSQLDKDILVEDAQCNLGNCETEIETETDTNMNGNLNVRTQTQKNSKRNFSSPSKVPQIHLLN